MPTSQTDRRNWYIAVLLIGIAIGVLVVRESGRRSRTTASFTEPSVQIYETSDLIDPTYDGMQQARKSNKAKVESLAMWIARMLQNTIESRQDDVSDAQPHVSAVGTRIIVVGPAFAQAQTRKILAELREIGQSAKVVRAYDLDDLLTSSAKYKLHEDAYVDQVVRLLKDTVFVNDENILSVVRGPGRRIIVTTSLFGHIHVQNLLSLLRDVSKPSHCKS